MLWLTDGLRERCWFRLWFWLQFADRLWPWLRFRLRLLYWLLRRRCAFYADISRFIHSLKVTFTTVWARRCWLLDWDRCWTMQAALQTSFGLPIASDTSWSTWTDRFPFSWLWCGFDLFDWITRWTN